MTYESPYNYGFSNSDEEAERRAQHFRSIDPFPHIPPALLSSEHVSEYVRVTGMLFPFSTAEGRLKSASYEALPGKKFIRWDEDGRKLIDDIEPHESYELKANSITFMQIEPKIRLPDYIALRFNLRIKHVHRGLLLGTGPLVDPGFKGDLLIPLHNLTSDPYVIRGNEGLIWIEFTKTSRNLDGRYPTSGEFWPIEQRKTDMHPEAYFERASQNNPIRSSIPVVMKDAREKSNQAAKSAREAVHLVRLFTGIGILAIAGTVVTLLSYFGQISANVVASNSLAGSINKDATQASSDAKRALAENESLKFELEDAKRQIERLREEIRRVSTDIQQLNQQGNARP